jgi:hypothetical protein
VALTTLALTVEKRNVREGENFENLDTDGLTIKIKVYLK